MSLATMASAQVTVFSGTATEATACSLAARHANANAATVEACTHAILTEPLSARDLAGTYVNRAVLYMVGMDWSRAMGDLNQALSIDPRMGEAMVNRGAVLIAEHRYAEGVAEIDRGLMLRPEEPERAYYNRGLAKERLDDVKGAYYDYLKASELAPTWVAPQEELKRFNVSPAHKG
jgi:tetratricopeptide (TPR) repeat protein